MFSGRELSDVLEGRTRAAIAAIARLETWDEDSDATEKIALSFDVTVPAPRWHEGRVQFGASDDQRMTAAWSWPVDGDAELLAFGPTTFLTSGVPFAWLVGSGIYATVTEHVLTAPRVDARAAEVQRWTERNLENVRAEVDEWRNHHRRRVRDALRKRRELLERVLELEAAA